MKVIEESEDGSVELGRELELYKANRVGCRINEDTMEIGHALLEI